MSTAAPSEPPPPTPYKGRPEVDADGNPQIRLYPSSNLFSILADVRGAMRVAGSPDYLIAEATDALLLAPVGTYSEVAARYVTIANHPKENQ